MKDFAGLIFYIAIVVAVLWVSYIIFNAVVNSDLPMFWKYILLR